VSRSCRYCGRETWSPHSPYCREHRPSFEQRQRWAAKSREARGYGNGHKALRERAAALVAAGLATCARCGRPIPAGAPFDLDHSDDRAAYLGVSHTSCNRRAGARKANAKRRALADVWTGPQSSTGVRWSRVW
jgi:hypothetical protein